MKKLKAGNWGSAVIERACLGARYALYFGNLSVSYNIARRKAIPSCVGIESERIRLERISAVKAPRFVQQLLILPRG